MQLPTRVDLASTFRLHSSPTATKTIYLDFNGHATTRTAWNNQTGNLTITTPAFSADADASAFSDAELERIQYIWQRVAEDFAPFDVDVTTEDLGEDALINSGGTDREWGVRAAVGGSYGDWYKFAAGGIAYINVVGLSAYGPAFVFSKNLGNGEKNTAEAISHEIGHTLGLCHDGCQPAAYFKGHGGGKTGWAPIMGVGYGKAVTQWSQGEYNNATNKEDDLSIISSSARNGFGFRPDDFGDSIAHAKPLAGPNLSQFGIITTRKDTDCFAFTTGAGKINISITSATQAWVRDAASDTYTSTVLVGRSPNLDIAAMLYRADGALIATSNPPNGLSANFGNKLEAGTYYLLIDGVGFGDPLKNGYSDYGSLGGYLVSGSLAPQAG